MFKMIILLVLQIRRTTDNCKKLKYFVKFDVSNIRKEIPEINTIVFILFLSYQNTYFESNNNINIHV